MKYVYAVFTDSDYAPCSYLLCRRVVGRTQFDTRRERDTVLFQSDWDIPALASLYGWVPCTCRQTDGTVSCPHKDAGQMMAEAAEYLEAHEGEEIPATATCEDYFGTTGVWRTHAKRCTNTVARSATDGQ